ncbi:MAG: hypothetical protein HY965_00905 [Ignavibacteriales bacterium]|nr:hypothetical protein [Ignavibacteriales bacterium]
MRFIVMILLLLSPLTAQGLPFRQANERLAFANQLFCSADYLRAAEEYAALPTQDSTLFFRSLCLLHLDSIDSALTIARELQSSLLTAEFYRNMARKTFSSAYPDKMHSLLISHAPALLRPEFIPLNRVYNFMQTGYAEMSNGENSDPGLFHEFIKSQTKSMENARYNPALAAGLSAVLPGAGKIYTRSYEEGVAGFILTGLFTYLTLENFKHGHTTRGWITGVSAALFYGGTIYGSYTQAIITTDKEQAAVKQQTLQFLYDNDYFLQPRTVMPPCE